MFGWPFYTVTPGTGVDTQPDRSDPLFNAVYRFVSDCRETCAGCPHAINPGDTAIRMGTQSEGRVPVLHIACYDREAA